MHTSMIAHGLSFDIEDWYQSCVDLKAPISSRAYENTMQLLDLLSQEEVQSTFFIQGMVAEAFPNLVKEAQSRGHEIGTHGYSHSPVYELGEKRFADELKRSIIILEDITGKKVLGHRAPDFSLTSETPWAYEIMASLGLRYDSSIFPIKGRRYGLPESPRFPYVIFEKGDQNLWEVPLATIKWGKVNFPVAGGGYVRHFPLWFTQWALNRLEEEEKQAIMYFHPYEIDSRETLDHRRSLKNWKERLFMFRQGLFRNTMEDKLKALCKKYRFVPISKVLDL